MLTRLQLNEHSNCRQMNLQTGNYPRLILIRSHCDRVSFYYHDSARLRRYEEPDSPLPEPQEQPPSPYPEGIHPTNPSAQPEETQETEPRNTTKRTTKRGENAGQQFSSLKATLLQKPDDWKSMSKTQQRNWLKRKY